MIDQLKQEIAAIDRDLKPVLAHVAAAQARRVALAQRLAALEDVAASVKPAAKKLKPAAVKPDEPKAAETKGK